MAVLGVVGACVLLAAVADPLARWLPLASASLQCGGMFAECAAKLGAARRPALWLTTAAAGVALAAVGAQALYGLALAAVYSGVAGLGAGSAADALAATMLESRLYAADLGLGGVRGAALAAADMDSDSHVDLLVRLAARPAEVRTLLWHPAASGFAAAGDGGSAVCAGPGAVAAYVAAADFDLDGSADVLLMCAPSPSPAEPAPAPSLSLQLWLSELGALRSAAGSAGPWPESLAPVLVLDVHGDRRLDLVGVDARSGRRTVWSLELEPRALGSGGESAAGFVARWTAIEFLGARSVPPPPPAHPFAALADLNGDCMADLALLGIDEANGARVLELLVSVGDGYRHDRLLPYPHWLGLPALADVNGDGATDMVAPACAHEGQRWGDAACDPALAVVWGSALPLCSSWAVYADRCQLPDMLCAADPGYLGGANGADAFSGARRYPLPYDSFVAPPPPASGAPAPPVQLRLGDFNWDGQLDVAVLLRAAAGVDRALVIGYNADVDAFVPFDGAAVGAVESAEGGAVSVSFVDWLDTGRLGLLVQDRGGERMRAYVNNIHDDAFFLKTQGGNGVCPAWCPGPLPNPQRKPYGGAQPGGVFRFVSTALDGRKVPRIGTQLGQVGMYLSLETPYTVYGLGRISTHIEDLHYGVVAASGRRSQHWGGVIPNSQLFAFPYAADWSLDLYIRPSQLIPWILLWTAATMLILAVIAVALRWRERRQDQRRRGRRSTLQFYR